MDAKGKELRTKAKALTPILQIGKNGLTQGSIDLINRELDLRQMIKIKLLKGALADDAKKSDRRAMAEEMAKRTRAQLVEQVGSIVVLHRT